METGEVEVLKTILFIKMQHASFLRLWEDGVTATEFSLEAGVKRSA